MVTEPRGVYSLRRQIAAQVQAPSASESRVRQFPGSERRSPSYVIPGLGPSQSPGVDRWAELLEKAELEYAVERVGLMHGATTQLPREEAERRLTVSEEAQMGSTEAKRELIALIEQVLRDEHISVPDASLDEVCEAIFEVRWGLGILKPIYEDPTVDEIRINGTDKIYTVRRGQTFREPIRFRDEMQLRRVIERSLYSDRVALTRDNPRVETTRRDGSRVTAVIPPISPYPIMVIRKFTSMPVSPEAYLATNTFNERILELLKVLATGRASLLISGATGTGKTHLLRLLVSYQPESLRTVVLETDHELYLERYFPERDIVSLEAHPELDPPLTLEALFATVLRLSPDVVILGEARAGEALEMIKAAGRGHKGSIGTVHVSNAHECVEAICQMVLEAHPNRPVDVLRAQVAQGYHVVIQMVRWPSGRRMIREITEINWDSTRQRVVFNPLVQWRSSGDNPEDGDWEYPNRPTERLLQHLIEGGVTRDQLRKVGWA